MLVRHNHLVVQTSLKEQTHIITHTAFQCQLLFDTLCSVGHQKSKAIQIKGLTGTNWTLTLITCCLFRLTIKLGHLLTQLHFPQDCPELGLVNAGEEPSVGIGEGLAKRRL